MNPATSPIAASDAGRAPSLAAPMPGRVLSGPLPSGRKRILFLALRGICWLVVCLFFLPTAFFALPGFGAEPSWKLALQHAVSEGWGFGQRIVWTYGPLGFLEWRYPFDVPLAGYLCFDFLLLALFLRFTLDVSRTRLDSLMVLACLASLFTVKRMLHDQPTVAVYCGLLYLVLRNVSRPNALDATGVVIVSALLLLFKMNFGLMGIFLCTVILLLQARARSRSAALWGALLVVQLVVAWISARAFHTGLWAYLESSFAIAGQYNDMSWGPGPGGVAHWVVVGFFWCLAGLAAVDLRKHGLQERRLLYWVLGGAVCFVLYKTAIIRSDYNHNKCFLLGFPILCLAFVIHGPGELRRIWRFLFLASTAYTTLLMVAEFGNALIYMRQEYWKVFLPINYFQGINSYRQYSSWTDYVNWTQAEHPGRMVPSGIRRQVGTNSVDVFPFEASLALGSGLTYQPRPIPLTYGVMGPALEEFNLAFLESKDAPEYLFYVLGDRAYSIDGRYHLWEEPAVKRLLTRDYRPQTIFTNIQGSLPEIEPAPSPVLLLRHSPQPAKPQLVSRPVFQSVSGLALEVPDHAGELYARIRLKKTWLGRLISTLYRGSQVFVRFSLDDGTVRELRVLPSNLETGVLLNYFADGSDPGQIVNYLAHESRGNPKCLKVEFRPEHRWAYRSELEISYLSRPDLR